MRCSYQKRKNSATKNSKQISYWNFLKVKSLLQMLLLLQVSYHSLLMEASMMMKAILWNSMIESSMP